MQRVSLVVILLILLLVSCGGAKTIRTGAIELEQSEVHWTEGRVERDLDVLSEEALKHELEQYHSAEPVLEITQLSINSFKVYAALVDREWSTIFTIDLDKNRFINIQEIGNNQVLIKAGVSGYEWETVYTYKIPLSVYFFSFIGGIAFSGMIIMALRKWKTLLPFNT